MKLDSVLPLPGRARALPSFPTAPFVPARGISSGHLQTLCGMLLRLGRAPRLRRERWETPDGDFLDVDWLDNRPDAPHVLVLHGMEGSSRSGYVSATLLEARARGWGAVALNFRSCSGEPNRRLRAYHSRDTADVHFVIERIRARVSGPLLAVGFSLGGSVLTWALAEAGEHSPVRAAAGVCVPFDIVRASEVMDSDGAWRALYRYWFFSTLKAKAAGKAHAFPGSLDRARILSARTFREFDDAFTAPVHGFADATDYYRRASSAQVVGQVRRPTLFVAAMDDPFMPGATLPEGGLDNPFLSWIVTRQGGHLGFTAGSAMRPHFWAERQVVEFFARQMRDPAA